MRKSSAALILDKGENHMTRMDSREYGEDQWRLYQQLRERFTGVKDFYDVSAGEKGFIVEKDGKMTLLSQGEQQMIPWVEALVPIGLVIPIFANNKIAVNVEEDASVWFVFEDMKKTAEIAKKRLLQRSSYYRILSA